MVQQVAYLAPVLLIAALHPKQAVQLLLAALLAVSLAPTQPVGALTTVTLVWVLFRPISLVLLAFQDALSPWGS